MADQDKPKIQIDSDWKKQAQAEKERLTAEVEQRRSAAVPVDGAGAPPESPAAAPAGPRPVGPEGLPPANFDEILATLATQVFMFLGEIPHPTTGRPQLSLPLAKHYIDLLAVLDAKTRGNLDAGEKQRLDQLLYEARMRYVQVASMSGGPIGMPGMDEDEG